MGLSVGRQWVLCAGVCWREPTSNAAGGVREQRWARWEAELLCSYRSLSWSRKEFWMNLHRVIPDWGRRIWPVYLCIEHSLDIGWEGQEPPCEQGTSLWPRAVLGEGGGCEASAVRRYERETSRFWRVIWVAYYSVCSAWVILHICYTWSLTFL